MVSKSGRRNGSPPPKLSWKTPARWIWSTASSASAVVSSPGAARPDDDRQCRHRRLQASDTSQVRFTGDERPCSTKRLLTEEALDDEGLQEPLDRGALERRTAGERPLDDDAVAERLGAEQPAGLREQEPRAAEVVEQQPEPLRADLAVGVEDVAAHGRLRARARRLTEPGALVHGQYTPQIPSMASSSTQISSTMRGSSAGRCSTVSRVSSPALARCAFTTSVSSRRTFDTFVLLSGLNCTSPRGPPTRTAGPTTRGRTRPPRRRRPTGSDPPPSSPSRACTRRRASGGRGGRAGRPR